MPVNRGNDELGLAKAANSLRIPHDTEAEFGVEGDGREAAAHRRAAVGGVVEPVAAAQHTVRSSRGSCGVGHAC